MPRQQQHCQAGHQEQVQGCQGLDHGFTGIVNPHTLTIEGLDCSVLLLVQLCFVLLL